MSDVTNYDGRLEQMAGYAKAMYVNIAKVNNAYYDSVEDEYSKTLPGKYLDFLGIKKISGKTVVWNQQAKELSSTYWYAASSVNVSLTFGTNEVDAQLLTDTAATYNYGISIKSAERTPNISGHKYAYVFDIKTNTVGTYFGLQLLKSGSAVDTPAITVADTYETMSGIVTATSNDKSLYLIYPKNNIATSLTYSVRNAMIFDLTSLFGSGNEPATITEFRTKYPALYYAYDPGSLLNAGIVSVISKGSDDTTLKTYTVPEDITTMEGYGWSCPGAYNYINFETKQFVQAVGSRPYEAEDENDSTVITDGTNTHYELDEPLAFDVDLPDKIITKVEAGGSLTFANQHGDDYRIPVPVELEYIGV